jgi:hypothetical protein
MIGIIRKNAIYYIMYGIFLLIMSAAMWYSALDRLRTPIAVINSFFMFFIVVVPALSAVSVTAVFNLVLFQFFESTPSILADCVKIILLNASVVIMLAGAVFLLMYRYNVRMLMMVLVLTGVFFNFLGLIAVRSRGIGNIFEWPEMIVSGKPTWIFIVFIFVSLGVYHLIFRRALRFKEERLFD